MNQVALRNPHQITPSGAELNQIVDTCKILSNCPYYQKMGVGGILSIWLLAKEMNLPVMICLNGGMYTFSGQVTLSTQVMNMMIVNAGHRVDILELNERICTLKLIRSDRRGHGSEFVYSFTIEQASLANYLKKDNWMKHPKDMLFARCLSSAARKFMPDIIMNCYVHGELDGDDIFVTPIHSNQEQIETISNKSEISEIPVEESFHPSWDEFYAKYEISKCEDTYVFLNEVMQNRMPLRSWIATVNSAIENEGQFLETFEKWKKKKK
jgi:hypothetical protein